MNRSNLPKVICEKVKFSNCNFCNKFRNNDWTYIYIIQKNNIFNDGKGEINTT